MPPSFRKAARPEPGRNPNLGMMESRCNSGLGRFSSNVVLKVRTIQWSRRIQFCLSSVSLFSQWHSKRDLEVSKCTRGELEVNSW